MLKRILFSSASIFLISGSLVAQQPVEKINRNNFFYIAPVELFLNTIQLGYEHKLANHNTVALLGGFKLAKKNQMVSRLGGNAEFQYRINLLYNKEAISTITKRYTTFAYFAPYIEYKYEEITESYVPDISTKTNTLTTVNSGFAGVGFGVRFSGLENRFCLNLFAGGGLKYSDTHGLQNYDDFLQVGYTGIAPKVSFQMGIAF